MLLHTFLKLLDHVLIAAGLEIINQLLDQRLVLHLKMILRLKSLDNASVLHFACFYGYTTAIRILLSLGVNPNIQDYEGNTPLHFAVKGRNFNMDIEHFIISDKKHDIEIKRFAYIVTLLVQYGAKVDIQDRHARTPLFYAVMYDQGSLVQYLAQQYHSSVNTIDYCQQSPLHWVKSLHMAQLLFQMGAELTLNKKDQWGRTPLHIAVQKTDKELTQWMMHNGAHIDAKDNIGNTSLYIAIQCYALSIIQLLLRYGARLNEANDFGETPRMLIEDFMIKALQDSIIASHRQRLNKIKSVFLITSHAKDAILEDWLKLSRKTQYWIQQVDIKKGLWVSQTQHNKKENYYLPAEIVSMIDAEVGALYGLQSHDWQNLKSVFFKYASVPYQPGYYNQAIYAIEPIRRFNRL